MVKTQLLHHDENIDGSVNCEVSKDRTRKELVIDFDPYGLLSKFFSLGYLGCLYLTSINFISEFISEFQNFFDTFWADTYTLLTFTTLVHSFAI